jgi:hypothetical protein
MIYLRYFNVYYFHPNDALFTYGTVQSRTDVRQGDTLGTLLFNLAISTPLRNIGERCMDSSAIHAFSGDRKYLITTVFVPTVTALTREELGKVCEMIQVIKFRAWYPLLRPINLLR